MTTLREALALTPWRLLLFICRRRGLRLSSNTPKAELVDRLAQTLAAPANLEAALTGLAEMERQALTDLLAGGGQLPRRYLRPRYGDLRPLKLMARRAEHDEKRPSPLERLLTLGLIFYDRAADDLFVPAELIPLLGNQRISEPASQRGSEAANRQTGALASQGIRKAAAKGDGAAGGETVGDSAFSQLPRLMAGHFAPADLVCHDLAVLLALLQRDEITPLHGRWLPPKFLAAWGRSCVLPAASPRARSELQTGRRRFLHYLAESAGLLAPCGPFLAPTPAAWLWLEAARPERLDALWQAWLVPDLDRWRAFRLPGWDWLNFPGRLVEAINAGLASNSDSERDRESGSESESNLPSHYPSRYPSHSHYPSRYPFPLSDFISSLLARHPQLYDVVPATIADPREALADTLAQLLAGPYTWLGLVVAESESERGRESESERESENSLPYPYRYPYPLHYWPASQGWQGPADEDLPEFARFSIEADFQPDPLHSRLILTLDGGLPDPANLAAAIEIGSRGQEGGSKDEKREVRSKEQEEGGKKRRQAGDPGKEAKRSELDPQSLASREASLPPTPYSLPTPYSSRSVPTSYSSRSVLTPASIARALHHGWSPPALLDALNQLADRPLTGRETALLQAWAEAAGRVVIRPLVVLETTDPGVIQRLAATRRGRALIQRTLSPRAITIDPARLDQLVRRLEEQEGVPPLVGTHAKPGVRSRKYGVRTLSGEYGPEAESKREQGKSHQAIPLTAYSLLPTSFSSHLWLALQVYRQLGQLVRLPVRIPQAVLDRVAASLSPADIAGADRAAGRLLAALQEVIEGRAPFPSWPEEGLPLAVSLPVIEAAIATGQLLQLSYYTAGRDETTRRLVEPYRLERRGDVPYLVGFCRRAQAERIFRVDRIREIAIAMGDSDREER